MLSMMAMLPLLATDIYLPIFPELSNVLNTNTSSLQFSISVYLFGLAIGQILLALFSNHAKLKTILTISFISFIIGSQICAITTSINNFVIARIFQSIGASTALALWQPLTIHFFTSKSAKSVNAAIFMLLCISPAIAPIIGAAISSHLGPHFCFYFLEIYGLFLACLSLLLLPIHYQQNVPTQTFVSSLSSLFKKRDFINYLLVISACYSGYLIFLITYPVILSNANHNSLEISFNFIPIALSFSLGVLTERSILSAESPDKIIFYGLNFYTISILVLFISSLVHLNTGFITLALCILMFSNGLTLPSATLKALSISQEFIRQASTIVVFTRMISAFLFSYLISVASQNYLLFVLNSLLLITAVFAWYGIYKNTISLKMQDRNPLNDSA
jgi:DHA1 family bicyclomycin/chloramphenicol resistance-like MFS transporter